MLTDLYQFHSRALQQPRSASFPSDLWRNYLCSHSTKTYWEIPLSLRVEPTEGNRPNTFHNDWLFPVIALIDYYHHHHLHCLQLQTPQAGLTAQHSDHSPTGEQFYAQYFKNSINEIGEPWQKLCFYRVCGHPANHSSSAGHTVAKSGSNRPKWRAETGARTCQCLYPVRQRVWQKLKELSPY